MGFGFSDDFYLKSTLVRDLLFRSNCALIFLGIDCPQPLLYLLSLVGIGDRSGTFLALYV